MPTINRRESRPKPVKYKHEDKSSEFYGSPQWKKLRASYIAEHPLCECCLEHGAVEPATCVHHMRPWLRGNTEQEQWELFLDEKNLMAACDKCHTALHVKDRLYSMGRLDELTDKEWKYAHGRLD